MGKAILFAIIASVPLPVGAVIGALRPPSKPVVAILLGFAGGALVSAVAFELFEDAFEGGGAWRAGASFLAGATVFIVIDTWLERRTESRRASGAAIGFALLAGVTLDGVPENLALGVTLVEGSGVALLAAIFASNLPEAIGGAKKMREGGLEPRQIVLIWSGAAVLLAAAVVAGYALLENAGREALAYPRGFAAGAVLASLSVTLMPEAYREGGPKVAYATALGFLAAFLLAAG